MGGAGNVGAWVSVSQILAWGAWVYKNFAWVKEIAWVEISAWVKI